MEKMDAQRKGEIAYALIKERASREPTILNPNNIRRALGNIAKSTKIPLEELKQFVKEFLQELSDEITK